MISADISALASAVGLGVIVSAPIGPISLLCIRRALSGLPMAAFVTGLGPAVCDITMASFAVAGAGILPAIAALEWLAIVSGAILVGIGLGGLHRRKPPEAVQATGASTAGEGSARLGMMWLQGFLVTLFNPLNAAAVLVVTVGLLDLGGTRYPAALVVAFGVGCLLWWAGLALAISWLGRKLGQRLIGIVSLSVSLLVALAGVAAIIWGLLALARG